jgi:ribose/xylose/arabinose/galactoside ABC-type transport system permease subunit
MAMTPASSVFLLLSCIAAIAGVGCVFELSSGEPDLGSTMTQLILAASVPGTVGFFLAAVRFANTEES